MTHFVCRQGVFQRQTQTVWVIATLPISAIHGPAITGFAIEYFIGLDLHWLFTFLNFTISLESVNANFDRLPE